MRARQALTLILLAGTVAACNEAAPGPRAEPTTSAAPSPPATEFTLPACDEFVPKNPLDREVAGLVPPPGLVISAVRRHKQTPITQVTGFVPTVPVRFRRYYEKLEGIKVLQSEDEGFEAELLITDGRYRNFLKVRIQCDEGSQFVAVIAKEIGDNAGALPSPSGSPSG